MTFVLAPNKSDASIYSPEKSHYESPQADIGLSPLDATVSDNTTKQQNQSIATGILSYIILISTVLLVYVLYRNKKLTDTFRKLKGDFKEEGN